jgi:hypothetical protein
MKLNDIIQNVTQLIKPYNIKFAVLYGYHTYDTQLSVWAVKMAFYTEDDYIFRAIKDMISGIVDESLNDENLKIVNFKELNDFQYYEILQSGRILFINDLDFYETEKYRVMINYLDFLYAHDKQLEYSVKLLERRFYG